MWTLGIESTAHTLSFGLVDQNGIPFPSSTSTIKPEKGGIHPREAADHHKEAAARLLGRARGHRRRDDTRLAAPPAADLEKAASPPRRVVWRC